MAIQAWTDLSILVGGLELAGYGKNVELSTEVEPLDTTDFASAGWTELIGGNKSGSLSVEFMQDRAAGGVDAQLWAMLGASTVPKSLVTPSADGSLAYTMCGMSASYTPFDGPAGGLAMGRITGRNNGGIVRGTLMHPTTTARTSSGSGTARQLGAVVAGKSMYAALHVLSASGTTPSLTVKVQSDNASGFSSPTDQITFAAADETGDYEWSSAAGAITDDWWRVTWTIGGTNPSFLFGVVLGIL